MTSLRLALGQINPRVGDVNYNFKIIAEVIQKAKKANAQLIVFPELAILGYPPRDLLFDRSLLSRQNHALDKLQALAKGCVVIVGCVRQSGTRLLNNCAAVFDGGASPRFYSKQLLPEYGVFDEERYFEPGHEPLILSVGLQKVGLTICEDIWNFEPHPRPHSEQPLQGYAGKNLSLLVNLSSSPYHWRREGERKAILEKAAQLVGCPVAYCNQVGANEELIFDGCSQVVNADGETVASAAAFKEEVLFADLGQLPTQVNWPNFKVEWTFLALSLGVADFLKKNGSHRAIIGLSGGVDSSVVAAIAVDALGPKNILGVLMPSSVTSDISRSDALSVARNLGISTIEVPIGDSIQSLEKSLNFSLSETVRENLHPRIRMAVLMAIANQQSALLLNTSNKSEIATGYSTQYGDTAGALAVIGDLVKEEVYELARYINQDKSIIPTRVLERAPTAELRPNQTDQDRLPPYPVLDGLVKAVVEDGRSFESLTEWDPKWVAVFQDLYQASEFKRRQFSPILRVSKRAFGIGRRIPLSAQIV